MSRSDSENATDTPESGGALPPLMSEAFDSLAQLSQELERLAKAIAHKESELHKLFDLAQTVQRGVLLEDVLDEIFKAFSGVIPFERIGCAFLSEDGGSLSAYWAKSELGSVQIEAGYTQRLAGSSLETILRTGKPRILNDLEAYLMAKPESDATRRIVAEGGRSNLTCPLIVNGRPLGFLFFTSRRKNTYRDAHQYIYGQIAGQVALAIDKSLLYQKLMDQNRALLEESQNLELIATHDATTGVLNRGAIDEALRRSFAASRASGAPLGVIMADIDHFKTINDTFGHTAGDLALKEFSRRISGAKRETDIVGRYGGEEFLLVVAGAAPEGLLKTAERLRSCISQTPFDLAGISYAVTASFGAAADASDVRTASELTARADRALYRAKARGRDCCVLAGDEP